MSEGMKVAIVGQAGLCFGFRALGLKVFSPETIDEARAVMADLEKEDYALCSTKVTSGRYRRNAKRSERGSVP
jgi:vacuolar-type H+-ATPase subunit F/Vma7